MEVATEWLKHNNDPSQVREKMRQTAWFRRDFIHPTKPGAKGPNMTEILNKYPHLLESGMVNKH